MKEKIKKITLSLILSWIFGVLFLLAGLGNITMKNYIAGLLVIFCGIIILPYTNNLIVKKFKIELSKGAKIGIVITLLVIATIITSSEIKTPNPIIVDSTEEINQQPDDGSGSPNTEISKTTQIESATITIDKISTQVANLDPIRVTVNNTGDIQISPKFDVYVYNSNNNEACSSSPYFPEITSLSSGEKQTGELTILCTLTKDGSYTLKIDLLDDQYNKLDSATKSFSVKYWDQFEF